MLYTKHAPSDANGDLTVYASQHIDRTNVFFSGLTGEGGRIVHLINGSRFVCGRKFAHAPHILRDHHYTIDEYSKRVRGLKVCDRCFNGMTKAAVNEEDVKIDIVKLSQMHFKIISEAVANSILLASDELKGANNGMAISEPEHHEVAREQAGNVVLSSFKLKGKKGALSFPINTMFTRVIDFIPRRFLRLFGATSTMMRFGQMAIVRPPEAKMPHLMLIVNSSAMYYTACKLEGRKSETAYMRQEYKVTLMPYEPIVYNDYISRY